MRPLTLCSSLRLGACLGFLLGSLGWPDDERNNGADQHDTGRDVEGEVVRAGYVRGYCQDQRTKEGVARPQAVSMAPYIVPTFWDPKYALAKVGIVLKPPP